jgi:hypothetical protein
MPHILGEQRYLSDQSGCCDESIALGKRGIIRSQPGVFYGDVLVNPNKTIPTKQG